MHQFASNFPLHPDHLKYVMDEVRENVESALSYIGEL